MTTTDPVFFWRIIIRGRHRHCRPIPNNNIVFCYLTLVVFCSLFVDNSHSFVVPPRRSKQWKQEQPSSVGIGTAFTERGRSSSSSVLILLQQQQHNSHTTTTTVATDTSSLQRRSSRRRNNSHGYHNSALPDHSNQSKKPKRRRRRRQETIVRLEKLEQEVFRGVDDDDNELSQQQQQRYLSILEQYAQLGEGQRAQDTCDGLLLKLSMSVTTEQQRRRPPHEHEYNNDNTTTATTMILDHAYRHVLHAWCNQVKRCSCSKQRRRQQQQDLHERQAQYAASAAHNILINKLPSRRDMDYQMVIDAYLCANNVEMAHEVLRQLQSSSHDNRNITTLPTDVYNRVLNAWSMLLPSFSSSKRNQRKQRRQRNQQSTSSSSSSLQLHDDDENKDNEYITNSLRRIVDKSEWIWNVMRHKTNNIRNAQTYAIMIYTYCKSDNVQRAYDIFQELMSKHHHRRHLLVRPTDDNTNNVTTTSTSSTTTQGDTEQSRSSNGSRRHGNVVDVDARSFRMLVHALSSQAEAAASSARTLEDKNVDACNNDKQEQETLLLVLYDQINNVLRGMWELYDTGHYDDDVAPDVFLYTTAMNAQSKNVERVRALLDDMQRRHEQLGWTSLEADTAVYNALIHAIASQDDAAIVTAEEAGSVVKLMERTNVRPDTITYNTVMDACLASNCTKGRERAEQTLLWMVEAFRRGNTRVKPTLKSFSSVMLAWTNAHVPARAEALLDVMEERYRPPASVFEAIISSWCQQARVGTTSGTKSDAAKRALRLLLRMEELFEATRNEALRPKVSFYNDVIAVSNDAGNLDDVKFLRKRRDRMYPRQADSTEPIRLSSSGEVFDLLQYIDAPPMPPRTAASTHSFNAVISQLAKSGKPWAGQRAEDVLNYMLDEHLKKGNQNIAPNTVTFNAVMSAHARSSHPIASERAVAVLKKLSGLSDAGIMKGPDRISYNTVMNAYAKSADSMSGSMAESLFHELESLYEESKEETMKPDIVTYGSLLSALAKSREPDSAKRAEAILLRMLKDYKEDCNNVKPNTYCFNQVIYAWARSQDEEASKRVEMVLRLMQDMYRNGNHDVGPNTRTYNVVLYALANSKQDDAPIRAELLLDQMRNAKDVEPDMVSYTTTISAWANHRRLGHPGAVNATIMLLEDLYESDIEVTSSFFSNFIYSLTRSGADEAPVAAELLIMDLLNRIESGTVNVTVNTEIYNALIHCWAKSGSKGATTRAAEILEEMKDEFGGGNAHVRPNVQTYTSVIDAYAKSQDAEAPAHAERLLNRMNEDDDGTAVRPSAHTYTAVIQAHARSTSPSKAKHAQAILHRMKNDYVRGNKEARPSVVTYNAVLNACEYSVGETSEMEEAFRVACQTLEEIRACDYATPDDVTYGTFLGVIAKLMPKSDTRNELVELVFKRCCADGQLSAVVIKKLGAAAGSVYRYKRLLGGRTPTVDNLPTKWTRNVVTH